MGRKLATVTAAVGIAGLAAAPGASATWAKRAAAMTVKQKTAELIPDATASDQIVLLGSLQSAKGKCERGRKVLLKDPAVSGQIASDVSSRRGKFTLKYGVNEAIDDNPLEASVKKATLGKTKCKGGSSTFDPELVDSMTTFDYNEETMSFSGTISSVEPGCLQAREWSLRKDQVLTFSGTSEAGTGVWASPVSPAPAGMWVLRIAGIGLDSHPLAGGGLTWRFCSVLNSIKDVAASP